MKVLELIVISSALGACATGPHYDSNLNTASEFKNRVYVFRTDEHMKYFLRNAPIYVRSDELFELSRGEYGVIQTNEQAISIETYNSDHIGTCIITISFDERTQYFVEVAPIERSLFEELKNGMANSSRTGLSRERDRNLCMGMFGLTLVDAEEGVEKLKHTKYAD